MDYKFSKNIIALLNHVHLRAKRRGKGGKYKKNNDQENKLEQSEVIEDNNFLFEKLFSRLIFW